MNGVLLPLVAANGEPFAEGAFTDIYDRLRGLDNADSVAFRDTTATFIAKLPDSRIASRMRGRNMASRVMLASARSAATAW